MQVCKITGLWGSHVWPFIYCHSEWESVRFTLTVVKQRQADDSERAWVRNLNKRHSRNYLLKSWRNLTLHPPRSPPPLCWLSEKSQLACLSTLFKFLWPVWTCTWKQNRGKQEATISMWKNMRKYRCCVGDKVQQPQLCPANKLQNLPSSECSVPR